MIVDELGNISKYGELIPQSVIKFLKDISPKIEAGRYEIDSKSYANVDIYAPKPLENCKFEAHKKYVDIQMLLEGEEEIDCINIDGLEISEEYDVNRDIMFFANPSKHPDKIMLKPGKFVYIFPYEAHKPQIKTVSQTVKKIVVKIEV